MKKIIALLLAMVTAFSVFSCNSFKNDEKEIKNQQTESIEPSTTDFEHGVTENDEKEVKNQQTENIEPSTKDFEHGVVENGIYKSTFSNISFTPPDDWIFLSQDDLLKITDTGLDMTYKDDAEMYKEIIQKSTIYDMMSQNPATGESIGIVYENITAYHVNPDNYTVDQYIDNLQSLLTNVDNAKYTETEREAVTLVGIPFKKVIYDLDFTELNYKGKQIYYVTKLDNYIMSVIISTLADVDTVKYESCFS